MTNGPVIMQRWCGIGGRKVTWWLLVRIHMKALQSRSLVTPPAAYKFWTPPSLRPSPFFLFLTQHYNIIPYRDHLSGSFPPAHNRASQHPRNVNSLSLSRWPPMTTRSQRPFSRTSRRTAFSASTSTAARMAPSVNAYSFELCHC